MVKNLKKQMSSHEDRFPKSLFVLSRSRIAENESYEDMLSRSQMHVDGWDEVALAAQHQKRRNVDALVTHGGSCC
jgi:hypothetical protein